MRWSETRLRNGDCSKLHGQPLAQRPVKHRIARGIREIGEDNRVLIGELGCAVEIEVTRDEQRQHSRGGWNSYFPESSEICCHFGIPITL